MAGTLEEEIKSLGIDPEQTANELHSFRKTAMRLSTNQPRMIERFPDQWVALHSGKVVTKGDDMESVLKAIDEKGIPREHVIVRFIESEPRTLIL